MMHIVSMKGRTKNEKIRSIAPPPLVCIPLSKKFGNNPEPVVKIGDKVKRYQLIGKAPEGYPASVHSPISGTVMAIQDYLQVDGNEEKTIFIQNDFENTEEELIPQDYHTYTNQDILRLITNAGIVGQGGAEFPTGMKYKLDGKNVDTFIINAAECEPYLTSDYSIMAQRTEEFFQGIVIANRVLNADDIVIAIEEDNKELEEIFAPYFRKEEFAGIRLKILPAIYPQGGELQLIRSVTGIELPEDNIPLDAGIIMSNVGTIYAIYEAVALHKPSVERVIAVSGEKSKECGNFLIQVGTPVSHIIRAVGIPDKDTFVVVGGPMMGKAVTELDVPVTKGSTGILLLEKKKFKRLNCIWCGYCAEVCPMMLMPMMYAEYYRKGNYKMLQKYSLEICIDCGSCEYICLSNVPLLESIQKGKKKLKEKQDAVK